MDISLDWLNRYLEPAGVSADEADHLLTQAGFPLESRSDLPGGGTLLDVEVTSNRGDCLSHVGCAREIAAVGPGRTLNLPEIAPTPTGAPVADDLVLENRVPEGCALFTARLIRGVKIGPSPSWLVEALESVGARSINNVVDVTNFITLELGNPCHVFDHAKLAGGRLVVRFATKGERVKTLYEGEHELLETDLVVADGQRPQSLAGVIGGFDSQVDSGTADVVFEMATWDPVTIRTTGRRLNIRTDAAYRFERGIDPRTIDYAARRAVALICELTGGQLAEGVLESGASLAEPAPIALRPSACAKILGLPASASEIGSFLEPFGIACEIGVEDEVLRAVPAHRSRDLTREIDLIEEVGRARSLEAVPTMERIPVLVRRPQASERAVREVGSVLTGLGFYETVTLSFAGPEQDAWFCPEGVTRIDVDDDRRKAEPTMRTSVVPSLMACRRANQDARVVVPGGVRLFETAAVYGQRGEGKGAKAVSVEHRVLAMAIDAAEHGAGSKPDVVGRGLRVLRGAIDSVARVCFGTEARVLVEPATPTSPGWDVDAFGLVDVLADGERVRLGSFGLISAGACEAFGVDTPMAGAELDLGTLVSAYPPRALAHALPRFPGVERDLSLVVDESVRWAEVEALVDGAELAEFAGGEMVSIYRGKQVGAGRKSVTVRLRFRDPDRTLRHEEVDPQIDKVASLAREKLGAEIRS